MKPTFMRWVAIAALLAGGTFSAVANPPVAPPVSYGVEEVSFILCGRRKGWWRPWMQWRRRLAWIS